MPVPEVKQEELGMKKFLPYLVLAAVLAVGMPVLYLVSDFSVDLVDPDSIGLVPMLQLVVTVAVLMAVCCSLYALADWLVSRFREEPRVPLSGEMASIIFILSGLAFSWVYWARYGNSDVLWWIHLMGSMTLLCAWGLCLARQRELKHYQPVTNAA